MATLRVRNRRRPSLEGNSGPSVVLGRPTGPPKLHPPNHTPLTGETLPAKHFLANSRILTDYYHLPAVLSSAHRRRNPASRSVRRWPRGRRANSPPCAKVRQERMQNDDDSATSLTLLYHSRSGSPDAQSAQRLVTDNRRRRVSALVCAGMQGFRADPLRPGYAQEFGGRADPAPAAPYAWRSRRQAPGAALRGGASDAP
jgi:hypothetical protein